MRTSLRWINDYLDEPVSYELAERLLTQQGFPVEGGEAVGDDTVFEVEITSNRSDCQCHAGLAREIAAGQCSRFIEPDCDLPAPAPGGVPAPGRSEEASALTSVDNQAIDLCPVYTARVIRGVSIGPSPSWLVERLQAIGLRSVNNVVDVTNFVLFELGQPLHAFDIARLGERRIIVRRAAAGEVFTAIDGSKHTLDANMLVIADSDRPVAIAGVMGGLDSEVGDRTRDILLESAIFDPLSVRRTSRALKLASDSSFRFERGVDPRGVERASRRAARLIVELAGVELAEGVIRAGADEPQPRTVSMRLQRCRQLLGLDITSSTIVELLDRLGLCPALDSSAESLTCTVPTYRLDLEREVDLIEEVARLHGLDDVPVNERIEIVAQPMRPPVAARQKLGQVLVAHGYHEAITVSFISPALGNPFVADGCEPVVLDDDTRGADAMLRPSLVSSMLICRKTNQDVGNTDVALFETGSVWSRRRGGDGQIIEQQRLVMLLDAPDPALAVRALRGTFDELVQSLAGELDFNFTPADGTWFSTGIGVRRDGREVGVIGLVARQTQDLFDLQTQVVAGEFDLSCLTDQYPPVRTVAQLARMPGIERDLSVIVDEQVVWQQIETTVQQAQPELLERLTFLNAYRGKPIPQGRKSVSLRMLFRDPQRTLRHEQVDPQVEAVLNGLKEHVNAELRG